MAASRRLSLQFSPTSPVFSGTSIPWEGQENVRSSTKLLFDDVEFEGEKDAIKRSTNLAIVKGQARPRTRWDDITIITLDFVQVDSKQIEPEKLTSEEQPILVVDTFRFHINPCSFSVYSLSRK